MFIQEAIYVKCKILYKQTRTRININNSNTAHWEIIRKSIKGYSGDAVQNRAAEINQAGVERLTSGHCGTDVTVTRRVSGTAQLVGVECRGATEFNRLSGRT